MKIEFYNSDASAGGAGIRGDIAMVTTAATGSNWDMVFKTSAANAAPTEGLRIKSNNVVQMANYGAGTATFDAIGNISSVSDERLKDVKREFSQGIEVLLGIRPIVYKWNERSGLETEHEYVGFSAQNVLANFPEGTGYKKHYEKDNKGNDTDVEIETLLSLQDRAIMAALVNAVKELHGRITALEEAA
jgi:hypothetical protein